MWESSHTSLIMNLILECERRQISVEFLVWISTQLSKHVGELLKSGMQSGLNPFQQLIYVLEGTSKYLQAMLTLTALNTLKNASFEITMQCAVPLSSVWLFSHELLMDFHPPLPPCSRGALVHCWAEAGAEASVEPELLISRLLGLVSFHAYFLPLIGATWYWYKTEEGLQRIFFFKLLYPVIQPLLILLWMSYWWVRNAELYLADLTPGIRILLPHHPG